MRVGHAECVGEVPELADLLAVQEHLDDVEADLDGRLPEPAQVIERRAGEAAAAFGVDCSGRAAPVFGGAGFDFDEDEAVGVAEDQVDLAAGGAVVGGEELEAQAAQVASGQTLAEPAAAQVGRQRGARRPGIQALPQSSQVHAQIALRPGWPRFITPGTAIQMNSGSEMRRACPVCGGAETAAYLEKGSLRLVRCAACGMVFVNPVPIDLASGRYYDEAGQDYYLSPAKLQSDYAPVRFERELKLFRRYCCRGRVLDVGCSSGAFLYHLNRRYAGDYTVVGTDVSGAPLDYAETQGVPVARGDFLRLNFDHVFEAVTFWAVLEHLAEPGAFLARAAELLPPGGWCFVLVPNLESLAVRWLGSRYRYIYPQHLNYFTGRTLRRLVGARFEVVAVRTTHFNPLVLWQDWRGGGGEVSNAARAGLLKRTTAYKQNPWLTPVRAMYRCTERVLGTFYLADNLVAVLRRRS